MTILTNKVDKLFANWDKPDSPGCAIAIIQDGQVLYSRGYGMANLEHDIPISTNSVFDIASTSKQFTAMSIALLARQDKQFEQQSSQSPVMMNFWVEGGKITSLEKLSPYTPTLDRLLDYAGEYFCDELDIKYQLSIEDDTLIMNRKSCPPDLLKSLYHNSFKGMYNSFEFIYDDLDRVIGLNLNGVGSGRIRSIHFIKQ